MGVKAKTSHTECKVGWRLRSILMLVLVVLASDLLGQQRRATAAGAKGEAQGSLQVMLTVQSSVGIVMDKDGQPQVIVANAPDVRDGVVYLKEAGPHGSPGAPQSANRQNPPSANTDIPAQKSNANQTTGADKND